MPRAQWLSRTFSNATLVAYRQGVGPTFLRAKRATVKSLALPSPTVGKIDIYSMVLQVGKMVLLTAARGMHECFQI